MKTSVLSFTKEVVHSVRYDAPKGDNTDVIVSSIYVLKSALSKPYPKSIKLTLEPIS